MTVKRPAPTNLTVAPIRAGRPRTSDAVQVAAWRNDSGASIASTAKHFGISASTVKRHCLKASLRQTLRKAVRRAELEGELAAEASLSESAKQWLHILR